MTEGYAMPYARVRWRQVKPPNAEGGPAEPPRRPAAAKQQIGTTLPDLRDADVVKA